MKKIILSLGFGVLCASAMAEEIELGIPQYGGNGCPAGTVGTVLSDDKQSLSILFDQYIAEAGHHVGLSFDRKACNVAIPVRVPHGYSVSILKIDYRGYNNLPAGARSTFGVEYFFAGSRGPSFTRNFGGSRPVNEDYLIENKLLATSIVWSGCGEDVILRTNTSIRVSTNARREQAMATVDTQDVSAAVVYQLQWRRCH